MNRNIGISIVLSLITCGIYQIYWFAVLTDEANRRKGISRDMPSGIVCLLLTLVTCGIYGWYWAYKMGETVDQIRREQGNTFGTNNNALYLILQIFILNLAVLALLQDEMNKLNPPHAACPPEA